MPRISTDNYDTVAAWNGSQDLFIVEQPDGTKVATPALLKQYVLGNSIDDIYSVMGQMGAKNLFNSQYSAPRTNVGTTATLGDDGHIIINGTANADGAQLNQSFESILPIYDLKVGDKLILSYKVISGTFTHRSSSSKTGIYLNDKNGHSVPSSVYLPSSLSTGDSGSSEVTLNADCFDNGVLKFKSIQMYLRNGDTFNNLELAIMLRLASDTDNTYQPYAKTNRQLTEVIGDLSQTGLTGDSVAAQLGTAKGQIADVTGALNVEELRVSDGSNTSLIGVKFNGIIFFAGSLLRVTTTADTWVDTNTTHNMTLTRNLEVAIWSAATGDWSGFAKFGTDGSVKVYAKYSGNFIPNLLGTVKL